MKFFEYISKRLNELNVKKCFGIPGSYIMPIWDNLKDIDIVLCTNEQDASYIATGYAYEINDMSVLLTTASPGVVNALSGIAYAYKDNIPLLIISGMENTFDIGKGCFQEESNCVNQFKTTELSKNLTKYSCQILSKKTAVKDFEYALFLIKKYQMPVHLSIPLDIQNSEIEEKKFDFNDKEYYTKKLKVKFNKSLIVVGGGCVKEDVMENVYSFAKKISAPIISTMKGYSAVTYNNEMFLEKLGSTISDDLISFLQEYKPENIFVLGSSLGYKDFVKINHIIKNCNFLIIDKNKKYVSPYQNSKLLYLKSMNDTLNYLIKISGEQKSNIQNKILKFKKDLINKNVRYLSNDIMAGCINKLNTLVNKNTILTADAGNHYLDALTLYRSKSFKNFYVNAGFAAMGIGICSSIGFAFNNKKVVAITGDGCMLMNGNSIYCAKKYNLDVCFIVFNNDSLGRVRVGQVINQKQINSDLGNVDFSLYAKSFNIKSVKVDNVKDFEIKFKEFAKEKGVKLIEVTTSKEEIPLILKEKK